MVNIQEGSDWATGAGYTYGISADGSAVVGRVNDGTYNRVFRWTDDLGMVNIQEGSDWASGAGLSNAISADGSVVAGNANDGPIIASSVGPKRPAW